MPTGHKIVPRSSSDSEPEGEAARLFEELYLELRRMAGTYMAAQHASHTLQTTALVGEAYLRLARRSGSPWRSRGHFMAVAARAMRSVLVDHARRKHADKREREGYRVELEGLVTSIELRSASILDFDAALDEFAKLGASAERAVQVVELRFLCGLTLPEIAEALEVTHRTVERDWAFARAWLASNLR